MAKLNDKPCKHCGVEFTPRVSSATLCSKRCMYDWRKQQNWQTKTCLHCESEFEARIKDTLPRLFCSAECHRSSEYKKEK